MTKEKMVEMINEKLGLDSSMVVEPFADRLDNHLEILYGILGGQLALLNLPKTPEPNNAFEIAVLERLNRCAFSLHEESGYRGNYPDIYSQLVAICRCHITLEG